MEKKTYRALALKLDILSVIIAKRTKRDLEGWLHQERINVGPLSLAVLRLVRHEPSTIQALSKQMMIAPATLVPVIDTLVRKGFVARGADAADRRRNPLSLTSKGVTLLSKTVAKRKDSLLEKSLTTMGEQKTLQLMKLMEELTTLLASDETICGRISEIVARETA